MVAQACFLGCASGPQELWFDGEREMAAKDQIRLFSVARLPDDRFDVALNVDFMTEMALSAALEYPDWINDHGRAFV